MDALDTICRFSYPHISHSYISTGNTTLSNKSNWQLIGRLNSLIFLITSYIVFGLSQRSVNCLCRHFFVVNTCFFDYTKPTCDCVSLWVAGSGGMASRQVNNLQVASVNAPGIVLHTSIPAGFWCLLLGTRIAPRSYNTYLIVL